MRRDDSEPSGGEVSVCRRRRRQRKDGPTSNVVSSAGLQQQQQHVGTAVRQHSSLFRSRRLPSRTVTDDYDHYRSSLRLRRRSMLAPSSNAPKLSESKDPPLNPQQQQQQQHSFWCSMVNPRSRQWQAVVYQNVLATIIGVDLTLLMLQSNNDGSPLHTYSITRILQGIVSGWLVLDYAVRVATIAQHKLYRRYGPLKSRLVYMLGSATSWMDACILVSSIIPQSVVRKTWLLRVVLLPASRLCRVARLCQIRAVARALDAGYRVVYYNAEILSVALLVCTCLTLGTAVLLYELRPPALAASGGSADTSDNHDDFASLAATLYLAIALLTGQGGPSSSDLPWYTKGVVVLTSLISVAVFAIPASMLNWGWEAEAARMAKRARRRALKRRNVLATHDHTRGGSSSSSTGTLSNSSSDGETTDDEYMRVIAMEGGEDNDNHAAFAAQSQWLQQVKNAFHQADRDGTGTLSLLETADLLVAAQQKPSDAPTPIDAVQQRVVMERLDGLEADLQKTNNKLDLILQLLQNRVEHTSNTPL
jgi:hypothetical protein